MSVWAVIGAVALASLLGSLHCAGMCGAFVAIAVGNVSGARGWRSGAVTQSAYHIGRLVSYATIGALAGAMGGLVNIASTLNGMRPVAASLAGATIVAFGVVTLLRLSGSRIAVLKVPRAWVNVVARISRTAMDRPPAARALMIGLCTTLLPCGWLYAFVITAAGTGSAATGALVMASFWLGTVPALAVVGASVRAALDPLGRRIPMVTALMLIVMGLYALAGRAALDPMSLVGGRSCCSVKHDR